MQEPARASRDKTWMGLIALVLLFAVSVQLVERADESKPRDWNQDRLTYLPSGRILKPMALGFDEAVADMLWIQAMMYFADAYLTGKSYAWLGHMLDVVTQLNPRMYQAYEFGGVVLTKEKSQLPKTLRTLDRGINEFPKDWRLRVYAAMAQLAHDSDYARAAEYIRPVTLDPDVPDHIRTLCASFLSKGGGRRVALAFLSDRYRHSSNAINKEIFIDKILQLYPADSSLARKRRETVAKILHEMSLEPQIEMVGLGVMHEYLTDSVSTTSRKLLDLLER